MTRDELIEKLKEMPNVEVLDEWTAFIEKVELVKINTYVHDPSGNEKFLKETEFIMLE